MEMVIIFLIQKPHLALVWKEDPAFSSTSFLHCVQRPDAEIWDNSNGLRAEQIHREMIPPYFHLSV